MEVTKETIKLSLMLLEYPYQDSMGTLKLHIPTHFGAFMYMKQIRVWVRKKTFVVFEDASKNETFPLSEWGNIEALIIEALLKTDKQQSNQ